MRILVISDIHANFEALQRIPERYDRVVCLGDLVDYGPAPRACIDWLRDRSAIVVRGNHDHAVGNGMPVRCGAAMLSAAEETRERMYLLLQEGDIDYLRGLPEATQLSLGGVSLQLVHAVPSDHLFRYLGPEAEAQWAEELAAVDADVLLVGHTHLPMVLRIGRRLIVNPGSVGQPRDGDPRAAFAVIEDGVPELGRVRYAVEDTVAGLTAMGLSDAVLQQLTRLLRTGKAGPVGLTRA